MDWKFIWDPIYLKKPQNYVQAEKNKQTTNKLASAASSKESFDTYSVFYRTNT